MSAITRVEGPMLLANLDRQGTDLQFTTTGESLFYLNFTNFQVGVNTSVTSETLTVNGNLLVTTVKIDKFSTITTTQINQDLTLIANGTGNVVVIGANVISGNIDNTQIGTVIPDRATFTRANVITKAELKLANVQNLTANRIAFTASDNTQLEDSAGLQWFGSNNTLVAQNFLTTQDTLLPSITSDNVKVPTIAENNVVYVAANNQLIGTPTLTFFASNNLFRVDGNIQMSGQTQNRIIYKNTNDQLVTSDRLTYDGTNFASQYPNINTIANIRISGDTLEQLQGGAIQSSMNVLPYNDLSAGRRLFLGGDTLVTGVRTLDPLASPPSDAIATVGYVTSAFGNATVSAILIAQGDSFVRVHDPEGGTATPNVYVVVDGVKNTEFTNGFANIQNLSIHDGIISTDIGEISISPYENARVRFDSNTSISIPSGTTAQRPPIAIAGDFRHNKDYNFLEWHDGVNWSSIAPSMYSQTLTGDGTTTIFNVQRPATDETVLVTINGVVQRPTTAYTIVGTTLTFAEAPAVDDMVEVRFLTYAITYASTPMYVNTPYTYFGTDFTEIDSWYISQHIAAQYEFVFKNPAQNQYAMGTVYLMQDGNNTYVNVKEYSNGATPYLIFNTYIDFFGIVRLEAKGQNTGNYIKFRATYFSDEQNNYITWVSSGNVGLFTNATRSNIFVQLNATVTPSGNITYALQSGSLPPGTSLYANGVVAGSYQVAISSNTTFNFTAIASAPGTSTQNSQNLSQTLSITLAP